MKLFFKYSLIIYFSITYVIVYYIADFTILKSDPKIYSFVPQDANQVIEVNFKALLKKVTFQFFYNKDYVLSYLNDGVESKVSEFNKSKIKETGIDISSKFILFSELWEDEVVWYCVLGVNDRQEFSNFAIQQKEIVEFKVVNNFAVCLLTDAKQIESVNSHLNQITNQNVKSIDSKIDLSKIFNSKNEINYYVSSKNNKYITDGQVSVNFNTNISFEGEYNTIGSFETLKNISQPINPKSALSFRTVFNLFDGSWNNNELIADYNGTKFITSNHLIPMHVYPQLDVLILNGKTDYWTGLVQGIDSLEDVHVDFSKQQITYLNQLSFSIDYGMVNNDFILSNDSVFFNKSIESIESNKLLELSVLPDYFHEEISFMADELNPPSMISNLKVNVFKNVMSEIATLNKIEQVYCSVDYSENKTKLVLSGEVVFKDKIGHSIIESGIMLIEILNTMEAFTNFE